MVVKTWMQTKSTSTIKMGKLRYINTMKYYAAMSMTKLKQWMNIGNIIWEGGKKTK